MADDRLREAVLLIDHRHRQLRSLSRQTQLTVVLLRCSSGTYGRGVSDLQEDRAARSRRHTIVGAAAPQIRRARGSVTVPPMIYSVARIYGGARLYFEIEARMRAQGFRSCVLEVLSPMLKHQIL